MKSLSVLLFCLILLSANAQSPCDTNNAGDCIGRLGQGFNFLKTYKIQKGAKEYVEHSYVFTKSTNYQINICTDKEVDKIGFTLFDSNRNMLASGKADGRIFTSFAFACSNPGIYYMRFTFTDAAFCGTTVLGFKSR